MNPIGERIREARKAAKITQPELAELCGWESQGRVSNYERGDRKVGVAEAALLAKVLGVSEYWLLTGKPDGVRETTATYSAANIEFTDIPYYRNTEISAGNGSVIHSDDASGSLTYRKDWIKQNGWTPAKLVVVRCKGDSMEPRVGDGDIVLINTAFEKINDNKIYAINYAGEAKIKRLVKRFDGSLVIRSDNQSPEYKDEVVPKEMLNNLKIIGQAVWVGGML